MWELAPDDEAQLLAITRRQRAEVRKGLAEDLSVHVGSSAEDRAAHYSVYAESVRNLGTPVFPRSLLDAALETLDGDILTVRHQGKAVSSVLSFYHDGAVMPYWGGGTHEARRLRANDRLYYELMLHARRRGCRRPSRPHGRRPHRRKDHPMLRRLVLLLGLVTVAGLVIREVAPELARYLKLREM